MKKDSIDSVLEKIKKFNIDDKFLILSPKKIDKQSNSKQVLSTIKDQGFARIKIKEEVKRIGDLKKIDHNDFYIVVDRSVYKDDTDYINRLSDSLELAFFEGNGEIIIENINTKKKLYFNNKFEKDNIKFNEPSQHLFSFNNPLGACSKCGGYGDIVGIDPELVIPNTGLSVYENAIAPWKGDKLKKYKNELVNNASNFDFPVHKPYYKLKEEQKQLIWNGNEYFKGINHFFKKLNSFYRLF